MEIIIFFIWVWLYVLIVAFSPNLVSLAIMQHQIQLNVREMQIWTFFEFQNMCVVFLFQIAHWFQNCFRNWNRTIFRWSRNFFNPKNKKGGPFSQKIFFLDLNIFFGIKMTGWMSWFHICKNFFCELFLTQDIDQSLLKN